MQRNPGRASRRPRAPQSQQPQVRQPTAEPEPGGVEEAAPPVGPPAAPGTEEQCRDDEVADEHLCARWREVADQPEEEQTAHSKDHRGRAGEPARRGDPDPATVYSPS